MADLETLPNPRILCEECNSAPWKYRCPSCSVRSCSLPCVKSHKSRTNCTGKRNRTEFVPLSNFDDNLLISDYNLLEETKRVAESAHRMSGAITGFHGYIGFKLPRNILMLRSAANRRGTKLLLLPPAMSKRQTNQSRFDRRRNAIFWTIEWRFHATDAILVDHGVNEHASLFSAIEKHLAPTPLKNKLSPYRNVQIDDLKFLIRKTPKGLKSPFRELNVKDSIGTQLADIVILEYPVIFVFLPSHTFDFEVEKPVRPALEKVFLKKEFPCSVDRQLSPKGNLFTEEEIDEGGVPSDTVITDLMGSVPNAHIQIKPGFSVANHIPDMQITREPRRNCSATANSARPSRNDAQIHEDYNMEISREVGESSKPGSNQKDEVLNEEGELNFGTCVNGTKPCGDANLDFQQELKDAYSELMGEIDPDEFLCFDGACNELDNMESFLREDELEEGEIPS